MSATVLEAKMLKKLQHDMEYKYKAFSSEYMVAYTMFTELLDHIRSRG